MEKNNFGLQKIKKEEELEGLDSSQELEMRDYPLDNLLIRSEIRTVYDIYRRILQKQYIMDPDFQRDFIWDNEKQSKLIESMLMRIPLPVFYLAERNDGKIIVIDGLQRLTTISNYLNNVFPLRKLDKANSTFNGKFFNDLPQKLKTRIEDTQLIIYILDEKVPERARMDIFDRVNGGVPLTRQQMRNCMYCGQATLLLNELSKHKSFLLATGNSLNWRTMRDREFINRFFAFYILGVEVYQGDMDQYLADALININKKNNMELEKLKDVFITAMDTCYNIWKSDCFRRPIFGRRSVINAALFDVISVLIAKLFLEIKPENYIYIKKSLAILLSNEKFIETITSSTNSLKQVKMRFHLATQLFKECF